MTRSRTKAKVGQLRGNGAAYNLSSSSEHGLVSASHCIIHPVARASVVVTVSDWGRLMEENDANDIRTLCGMPYLEMYELEEREKDITKDEVWKSSLKS
uniref:Uncharacterized protein n=1 Tax=Steinernema glaseri TaxID=37863 RepID=A0A1I7YBW6_9BILA